MEAPPAVETRAPAGPTSRAAESAPAPAPPPAPVETVGDSAPLVPVMDERPAAAPAAPPVPAPAVPPAPPASAAAAVARDVASIRNTLSQYQAAFGHLNAAAVSAVWPSVDSKALERAFRGLDRQELAFEQCDIRVDGTSAAASCSGTLRYVTKVGNKAQRVDHGSWQFRLQRGGAGWVIERVESR